MFDPPTGRLLSGAPAALERGVRAWKTQAVDWDRMDEAVALDSQRRQTTIARPVTVSGRGTFLDNNTHTLSLCPTNMDGW